MYKTLLQLSGWGSQGVRGGGGWRVVIQPFKKGKVKGNDRKGKDIKEKYTRKFNRNPRGP